MRMSRKLHLMGAAAGLALLTSLTACGGGASNSTTTPAAGGATSSAAATQAKGANKLCAAAPTDPKLSIQLTRDDVTAADPSNASLQAINENGSGADGPFTATTVGGRQAIEPQPGSGAQGDFNYEELYFATGGAVDPSVKNALLCVEVYDGAKGQEINSDYSGNNADGPVNGAYDSAPEVYMTSGSKKWQVISFSFTDINFQSGAAGAGKENGGADFRITLGNPLQQGIAFDKAWLVTKNVPATQSLAHTPAVTGATAL